MAGPPPPLSSSRAERGICFSWLCFHHLHENVFQVLHRVAGAQLRERAFGQELAVVDDADGVAELFGFAHHVGGEDDGLAAGAAVADEADDGAGGHDVEADGGLVGTPFRRVVDVEAGDPGGAVGGLEDGGEQAQRGGLAGAVRAQEAVDLRGLAAEADVVDGADFPALLVAENLGQVLRFNHGCPGWLYKPAPLFVTGAGREKQARLEGTWGERWDLNPRPSEPQSDALPAELRSPPTGW